MAATPGTPFVWRLSLSSPPERVFELLDSDEGRERHWAVRSRALPDGFELDFTLGLTTRVAVLERRPPTRLAVRYFGAECVFDLEPSQDGGCLFQVSCRCEEPDEWLEFYAGWVSWLLVLKAAADFGVDLRNGSSERTWRERYVDP